MSCPHIFSSDEGTSHCTLAGVTAEQWGVMRHTLKKIADHKDRGGYATLQGIWAEDALKTLSTDEKTS